ncbi:phosphatidylglycerophosphatase A [bacterium]|nr:phosphatidylglycerophosphatase A [bacterium]NIN93050.1 phosphatidylglycerophosphatase A [bacterium]NIO18919.1 phosphatidylglycerophosphatase A [bacterium]NIO74000.1 phosphatidylglycerophosphatase A [bacterium]
MEWLIRFLATGFFVGYSPVAPGTMGTLVAFLLYALLPTTVPFYWMLILCLIIGGTIISHWAENILGEIDSPKIVIDEMCGYFIAMAFLPKTLGLMIVGFVIYRLLDVIKIYPIKKLEMLAGGLGIMLDDIYAGVVTNIILHIIHTL